jgi:hypothetical protein
MRTAVFAKQNLHLPCWALDKENTTIERAGLGEPRCGSCGARLASCAPRARFKVMAILRLALKKRKIFNKNKYL